MPIMAVRLGVGMRAVLGLTLALSLASSVADAKLSAPRARPAKVDRIVVKKSAHSIALFAGELEVFRTSASIGPGGDGPKKMEGDKVTPVGRYHIVSKSPSRYRVFMGLDYPNAEDRARFARLKADGTLPNDARIGGDVGIHGAPPQPEWKSTHKAVDWTLGCVAVDDDEIEVIARQTQVGTLVEIED